MASRSSASSTSTWATRRCDIGTLYDLLGVARDASVADIRAGYRRAARAHHPDRHGEVMSPRMAEINEAWRVLADPQSRRNYDLSLAGTASAPVLDDASVPQFVEPRHNPLARYQDSPRFPWRFMGVLLLIGIAFVALGVFTAGDSVAPTVDNVLHPGDCVVIDPNGDAAERLCTEAHDGTVEVLLTAEGLCPAGSEPHRDRQGMGIACVRMR